MAKKTPEIQPAVEDTRSAFDNEPGTPAVAVQEETIIESASVELVPHKAAAVATLADVGSLMEDDAQDGSHGFRKEDIAIPFLRVLQSNSPQVKRQNAEYVDGAEEGFFFNNVTKRVWNGSTGIDVVPIAFERQATLWWPREKGGPNGEKGLVRPLPMAEAEELFTRCKKNEKGKDVTPDGQELVFAAMYYLFIHTKDGSGEFDAAAFPLTFTQIKKARTWNALISGVRLPNSSGVGSYNPRMYGFTYHLDTIPESNAKGEWMGLRIIRKEPLLRYEKGAHVEGFAGAAQLYLAAREFEMMVHSGRVKVDQAQSVEQVDDGGSMNGVKDEKLPF